MVEKQSSSELISSKVLLSVATSPFLLAAIAAESLTKNLIEIGAVCEEVFRGDRLPILHVPEEESENK